MGPKLAGRPKDLIHKLYKKVTDKGYTPNNPHFACKGCDLDIPGKELTKLCAHCLACTYLFTEQTELAHTCVGAVLKILEVQRS
jgi:hypothetical protein